MLNKILRPIAATLILTIATAGAQSCSTGENVKMEADANQDFAFEALFYNNSGENFVTFSGHSFDIDDNKVKQYGYDSDGSYISYYETSSVVSITIDGHSVDTCGSTVLFKDTRIKMTPIDFDLGKLTASDESGYSVKADNKSIEDWYGLTNWWYKNHKNGKDNIARVILIQSQDGYNIGAIEGKHITWKVAGKLPKTTLITVDDKPLYIHRCNFTIIDAGLFKKVVRPQNTNE